MTAHKRLAATLGAACIAFAFVSTAAEARSWSRDGSYTGPAGRTASWAQGATREPGYASGYGYRTGRGGRTASYDYNRVVDRNAGYGSYSYDRAYRDGTSRSVDRSAVRVEPGVFDYAATRTQRDGDVISRSGRYYRP